jgi:hypothetical protein
LPEKIVYFSIVAARYIAGTVGSHLEGDDTRAESSPLCAGLELRSPKEIRECQDESLNSLVFDGSPLEAWTEPRIIETEHTQTLETRRTQPLNVSRTEYQ